MSLEAPLGGLALIAGAAYGAWPDARGPAVARAALRTVAVGALAILTYVEGAPTPLTLALWFLALSAPAHIEDGPSGVGDAAAAVGLAGFVWLFVSDGGGRAALIAEPVRSVGVAAAFAACVTLLAWLLARPREPAIAAAARWLLACAGLGASLTLPHRLWPAMAGALLVAGSEANSAARRVKDADAVGPRGEWALHLLGCALATYAYLR